MSLPMTIPLAVVFRPMHVRPKNDWIDRLRAVKSGAANGRRYKKDRLGRSFFY